MFEFVADDFQALLQFADSFKIAGEDFVVLPTFTEFVVGDIVDGNDFIQFGGILFSEEQFLFEEGDFLLLGL